MLTNVPLERLVVQEDFRWVAIAYIFQGRARMLYDAGYCTLQDVASAEVKSMSQKVEHLPFRTAVQIIQSAKVKRPTYSEMKVCR